MSSVFTSLSSPLTALSNLVKINNNEFIGASFKYTEWDNNSGIFKYNVTLNEWELIFKYPSDFQSEDHQICYDKDHDTIYLYGNEQQMVIINLTTSKIDIHETTQFVGEFPVLLMIDNECHMFLGGDSKDHYKWNSALKQLEKIYEFSHLIKGLSEHGIVHIQSENKLLLFGGYDDGTQQCTDQIWAYYIQENKAIKLNNIKLPAEMSNFGWILSDDERYVIIFGGETANMDTSKNILILDINEWCMYQSQVELDNNYSILKAISMKNEQSGILVDGYIRQISMKCDLNVPMELCALFHSYYDSETIYIIDSKLRLYRIELNDILRTTNSNVCLEFFS